MVGKFGWTLFEAQIIGKRGSAQLLLTFVHGSSTDVSGAYTPAESIEIISYDPDDILQFGDMLKLLANELQEKRGISP